MSNNLSKWDRCRHLFCANIYKNSPHGGTEYIELEEWQIYNPTFNEYDQFILT